MTVDDLRRQGRRCPCPTSSASSQEDAEQALRDAGFKTTVKEAFSDSVPAGDVISTSPAAGKQATKGRTITLDRLQGRGGRHRARRRRHPARPRPARSRAAGLNAEVTEQETTKPPGTVIDAGPDRRDATVEPRARTVQLTVAKERPKVPTSTNGNPTDRGGHADARGGRLQGQDAPTRRRSEQRRPRDRPVARAPARARSTGAHGHDLPSALDPERRAVRDPHPDAMRVAVLAGGRSSEHDVSLNSAAAVREGVAAAGPRGAAGDDRALRRLAARRRGAVPAPRRRPARRRRRLSRSCTARSARTARCRACWSSWTCPTSARACSPRRCAWTRSSSRRCWRRRTSRRSPYAGVRLARWRAEPEAVLRELAVLGTPVFVKPARLGSSVGIAKVVLGGRARPGAGRAPSPTTAW